MLRLLPLFAFAILPAVVAAPVPRDTLPPEFGADGVLTRAELEKVKFDSRPAKVDFKDVEKEDGDEIKRVGPAKPRPKNRYDVAVEMPKTLFREGEPVAAYFVLRNNRGYPLSLDARLSLFSPEPTLWNSCDIRVRDKKTGETAYAIKQGWAHGHGRLVNVQPDGFYCVKGDLGRGEIPAGVYEVDWRYGSLRSAPVTFTIQKADAKPARAKKPPAYSFYHIQKEPDDEETVADYERVEWPRTHLGYMDADGLAAALASGEDVIAPDIHAIPVKDKLVEAWVEWRPYRDGDRVIVTLRAVPPHKEVAFDEIPQLHLQIELPAGMRQDLQSSEPERGQEKAKHGDIVTPLTIEARLPANWRDGVGVGGSARVAVIVTAKEIELPRGPLAERKLQDARKVPDDPPMWNGVVRTEFTQLRFPPQLPTSQKP